MAELERIQGGSAHMVLANEIAGAIDRALKSGLPTDHAVCIAASVAADYGRYEFGPDYVDDLAKVITERRNMPLPERQ